MEDQSFHPYIPADRVAPEMTAVSVLLGAVLGSSLVRPMLIWDFV